MADSSRKNPIQPEFKKRKIGTEPKSTEFSDLNDDVIGMIIENLALKERLALSKVSRGLRALVDRKKSILKALSVTCGIHFIAVLYNDNRAVYADPKCDPNLITNRFGSEGLKLIKTEDYLKIALGDLQFAFNDPTVQLRSLRVDYYPLYNPEHAKYFFGELENILKSLNPLKVSTKRFLTCADFKYIIPAILPHLKPGTLKGIDFGDVINKESGVDQILNLEQWKQATEFTFKDADDTWAERHLMHFKTISIHARSMDLERVIKWRNFFSKSPNFEFADISVEYGFHPVAIQYQLGNIISSEMDYGLSVYIFHRPITTDSNHLLEIKVKAFQHAILFTKIARPV